MTTSSRDLITNLRIKSLAFSDIGTSGGNISVSFQFITFLYVSWGVSEQKGGYPMYQRKKVLSDHMNKYVKPIT